eukprot:TRINITY_DN25427_c0_g1_i2.p1 TRINITY_DN25427_c0_g1~~TRINITY_DN25427_c0_g1_i2.p1  ORF type:complete len:112 (-),score=17.62 TRINITY_DN25427_c0_g1_i2:25-360(-)
MLYRQKKLSVSLSQRLIAEITADELLGWVTCLTVQHPSMRATTSSNSLAEYTSPYSALILSLIHISEPTRLLSISYAVFCLKKKKKKHIGAIYNTTIRLIIQINWMKCRVN